MFIRLVTNILQRESKLFKARYRPYAVPVAWIDIVYLLRHSRTLVAFPAQTSLSPVSAEAQYGPTTLNTGESRDTAAVERSSGELHQSHNMRTTASSEGPDDMPSADTQVLVEPEVFEGRTLPNPVALRPVSARIREDFLPKEDPVNMGLLRVDQAQSLFNLYVNHLWRLPHSILHFLTSKACLDVKLPPASAPLEPHTEYTFAYI